MGARSGLATSALLVAVGSVVLLAGTAIAALGLRGHRRRLAAPPSAGSTSPASAEVAPASVEDRDEFRTTLALLITGVAVLVIGLIGQAHWS